MLYATKAPFGTDRLTVRGAPKRIPDSTYAPGAQQELDVLTGKPIAFAPLARTGS